MVSQTSQIEPVIPAFRIQILSDEQLEKFKSNTFTILEKTGFHCPSEKALKIYAEHGGVVDFDTQIVKLSPDVILEALSHAPRYYTMGGRTEAFDLDLSKECTHVATDGTGTQTIDYVTRELRSSIKDDVAKSARISDYLSSISFYWPMVSAQDHPVSPSLHELDASFNNTLKHIQTPTLVDDISTRYAVEMAKVVAGSETEMRKRPPLSLLTCTIAPLALDAESMDASLVAAEAGIPVGFMAMPNTGSTAPATFAGTISQGDAEIVSAMVLIQMAYPGAPIYHSLMPGMTHPRTGAFYGHNSYVYAIGVELAHMWGVPTLAAMGGSDAHELGWESGMAGGKSQLLGALCGAETGAGMGLVRGSTLLYPEALVLETEIYHNVRDSAKGVDTSPDQMALDVIQTVGPRGHFLREKHTREYFRELGFSEVLHIPDTGGSYRDPFEVARERTDWILENHHPEPLSGTQQSELTRIIKAAERELSQED
ncbi:MAG: trimethylamine methyltransferase family protein [Anaerolineales bacterium]|nr:trimethylamine methyltransferase family protein [Anaerolineales bacterium]